MKKKFLLFVTLTLLLSFFNGCAFDLTSVNYSRRSLADANLTKPSWVLKKSTDIPLKSWSTTKLRSGTQWNYVGSVAEGEIYSTEDQIVTAVGSNTYEANIVLKGDDIVGLYLPVEEAFVDISKPVTIIRTVN